MLASFPAAHSEVVTSLNFSPHVAPQQLLCSTSGDDTAALWDSRQPGGACAARLRHHRAPVNHSLFLSDAPHALLTASDDRTIGYWDIRRPDAVVGAVDGFQDGVNKLLQLPPVPLGCGAGGPAGTQAVIASACDDGMLYVHALVPPTEMDRPAAPAASMLPPPAAPRVGALLDRFWVAMSTVNDVVLSPNPDTIITASEDCALRTWRLLYNAQAGTEERLLESLDAFENPVNHVAVVPPGLMEPARMAAATAAVEDSEDGAAEGAAAGAEEAPTSTTGFSEEDGSGCYVLAASSEVVIGMELDVRSGKFGANALNFIGHKDYVRGLEFTAAGTLLTVSDDSTAVEWCLRDGEAVRQVKLHEGYVMASALSPERDVLATGTDGGEIRLWRLPFMTERLDV